MHKLFLCAALLAAARLLPGAEDSFAGTWKYNPGLSKTPFTEPGMAIKEATMIIQETGDLVSVTITGTKENGSPVSVRYATSFRGGPVNYSEGGPALGIVASRRVSHRMVDFIATQDGKVISTNHATVSPGGEVLRFDAKGVDERGKRFHSVTVFEK
jgi:hypothetical protein